MNRIKMMLMASMAILAIGAVGSSAASADGTGRVEVVGTGGCDIQFSNSDWEGDDDSWSSEVESVMTQAGGNCDVDSVTGGAEIVKNRVSSETRIGTASLAGTFSFRVLSGLVTCTYSAVLTGIWHRTGHWAPPGPPSADPDIPHNSGNVDPDGPDKILHISGIATRISGPPLFCPATVSISIHLRDHAH